MGARDSVIYFVAKKCKVFARLPKGKVQLITEDFNADEKIIVADKATRLAGELAFTDNPSLKINANDYILLEFNKEHAVNIDGNNYKKLVVVDDDVNYLMVAQLVHRCLWYKKGDLKHYIEKHMQGWATLGTNTKTMEDNMTRVNEPTKFIALTDLHLNGVNVKRFTTFEIDEFQMFEDNIFIDGISYKLNYNLAIVDDKAVKKIPSRVKAEVLKNMKRHVMPIVYRGDSTRHILPLELLDEDKDRPKVRAFQVEGYSNSDKKENCFKTFFLDLITLEDLTTLDQ